VITIPRPDVSSRLDIFKVHTARKPLDPAVDLPACAAQTEGFSGADLESVCRLAALAAIRRALLQPHPTTRSASQAPGDSAVIYPADFHAAIAEVRHQIQKQRIEDVAMQATRDAGDRTVEPLPASASQLFQAYQEVQRERVRDTTASFRLN
jgi:SpoVK/Ycf46/Vps4 family AAA+-type ATPase